MKMLCQTEGHGQSCNRCQSARTQCTYSKPGRPGRPANKARIVSNPSGATNQGSAIEPELTGAGIPAASFPLAGENTWRNPLPEHAATKEAAYLLEGQITPWTPYGSFLDASSLPLDYTGWSLNSTEADVCPSSTTSTNHPPTEPGIMGEAGLSLETKPDSPIFIASKLQFDDQDFIQRLAHFHVTITCMIDYEAHLSPEKLEQEAAHVLKSSSKFLEIIQVLASVADTERHRRRGPQEPSPFNASIFLQLTSISIRLIEMHTWLYTSIYRCLQQEPDTVSQEAAGEPPSAPQLGFTIAGVRLAPTAHFRLLLILHTGIYYLSRIQKVLGEVEALRVESASEVSPALPLQTRMLISGDQKGRMAKIRSVLAKLKEEFGIYYSAGVTEVSG